MRLFVLLTLFSLAAKAETLSLFSMNVYMLPKPIHWSLQPKRTEVLAEQLKDSKYDLIFMQEAFMKSFRDDISEKLKADYPYSYYLDRDDSYFFLMGSGLFVLSRTPIQILEQVYFKECGGFDCFASKGSFLFEITRPSGQKMQFATTHLEAGDGQAEVRATQLRQIKAMLKNHEAKDEIQFLIGDLNIDYPEAEYAAGLKILGMVNAPLLGDIRATNARVNECYSTPEKKKWIDHALASQSSLFSVFTAQVKDLNFSVDGKSCPSSDHHAIEINFNSAPPPTSP